MKMDRDYARRGRIWRAARALRRRPTPVKPLQTRWRIRLWGELDLVDNAEVTRWQLLQLQQIKSTRARPCKVYVDLSWVVSIDASALLYLMAQLERLKDRGARLRGNYPRSAPALAALADAGFERFMRSKRRLRPSGPKQVEVRSERIATRMNPNQWLELRDFVRQSARLTPQQSENVYVALHECIENIHHHAYRPRVGRWYAIALWPPGAAVGRIVVLDMGRGIGSSLGGTRKWDRLVALQGVWHAFVSAVRDSLKLDAMRPRQRARAEALIGAAFRSVASANAALVWLACNGYRNATGLSGRGTGLNGLRLDVEDSGRGALHVSSGDAIVSYSPQQRPTRGGLPQLRGTIVCVDVPMTELEP